VTAVEVQPEPVLAVRSEVVALLDELGVRYEVVDGLVVVMPSATAAHEQLAMWLGAQLLRTASHDMAVLGSNYNYLYAWPGQAFVNADVVVARQQDAEPDGIRVPPLLMVEVLSRSTRRYDATLKKRIYESHGVPSYWLVDPDEPSLTVLELDEAGRYAETARVSGAEVLRVERPFPVELRLTR